MLKSRFITSPGIAKFRVGLLTIPVLAVFAIAAPTALAVEVSTLYTAQVPLDEEQDNPQALAYEMALAQVLLRVSGSELSADPDLVALMFPDPPSYDRRARGRPPHVGALRRCDGSRPGDVGDLMERFYRNLKSGKSKDMALRSAQLDLIRAARQGGAGSARSLLASFPYFWAPFQLYGDWQ